MPAWTSRGTSDAARPPSPTPRLRWPPTRLLLFAAGAAPGAWLGWQHLQGALGADPLSALVHRSGWWALFWLLATLAVTPLRRLSVALSRWAEWRWGRRLADWNGLVRQRRQLGLWSFAYASVHLALYAVLDAGSWQELFADASERPFIAVGWLALLALLPLAATSNQAAMRRLKKHWARLHRLAYGAAAAALLHAWWQSKVGQPLPWDFTAAATLALVARLWAWWRGDRAPAQEVPPRQPRRPRHPPRY